MADMTITAKNISDIRSSGYQRISVDLEDASYEDIDVKKYVDEIGASPILKEIDISDAVNYYGEYELLQAIGVERIADILGIKVLISGSEE